MEVLRKSEVLDRQVHELEGGLCAAELGPKFLGEIVTALRQLEDERHQLASFEAGPVVDEEVIFATEEEEQSMFMDDVHGTSLDEKEVREARKLEVDWVLKRNVVTLVPAERHDAAKHGPLLDTRWVDTHKKSGLVRSRMCCREIKARAKLSRGAMLRPEDVFSAMPPIESLKALLAVWASSLTDCDGEDLCMGTWDVSRAHFYGDSKRELYLKLPEEMQSLGNGAQIGRLNKTMYGLRDASAIWAETWAGHLSSQGYAIGKGNPSLFHDQHRTGFCHGDDFVVLGSKKKLLDFEQMLQKEYDIKRVGMIGFGDGVEKEMPILNRIVRVVDEKNWIELETDARLIERIVADYGLQAATPSPAPRTKRSVEEVLAAEATAFLGPTESMRYRSATMRAQYLGQDRVDVAEAVKCLSQNMAHPREGHVGEVKKLGRYLKSKPNVVLTFPRAEVAHRGPMRIEARSDSDWAGDAVNRRSTSGLTIRLQRYLVKHISTLQGVTSLSSTEAEFHACSKAAQVSLGAQSYLEDWGLTCDIVLMTDSSGAKAFSERRGIGALRHISTRYLWLQERIHMKHLRTQKILGTDNEADCLTKALPGAVLAKWMNELGYKAKLDDGSYTDV